MNKVLDKGQDGLKTLLRGRKKDVEKDLFELPEIADQGIKKESVSTDEESDYEELDPEVAIAMHNFETEKDIHQGMGINFIFNSFDKAVFIYNFS